VKVAISSVGDNLDAQVSAIFGRCPYLLLVDTETMDCQAHPNPAVGASGGAGIQAAQFVVEKGAKALLTGNVGPNAIQVLLAANLPVYPVWAGTVRQAVEAFGQGQLQQATAATTSADTGKAGAIGPTTMGGMGLGRGMGQGRGGGRGQGRGGGAGGGGRGGGGGGRR
jgi:predicted Fe-Mo cluster-binding NifX family protein